MGAVFPVGDGQGAGSFVVGVHQQLRGWAGRYVGEHYAQPNTINKCYFSS